MSMKMKLRKIFAACSIAAAGAFAIAPAQAIPVSLELALLVDVSGSIDSAEYALQKGGYVSAFQNPGIHAAIGGLTGGIAVTYIEWSSSDRQRVQVGWTHITDAASSNAFASAVSATTRAFSGLTRIDSAINFAVPLFGHETGGPANGFESLRQVIDISADGGGGRVDGTGESAIANRLARDAALAAGVDTINALAIGGIALEDAFRNNVIGGANAFVVRATDFSAFNAAVLEKIGREIRDPVPIPEPASLALFGIGLAGLAAMRRRKV